MARFCPPHKTCSWEIKAFGENNDWQIIFSFLDIIGFGDLNLIEAISLLKGLNILRSPFFSNIGNKRTWRMLLMVSQIGKSMWKLSYCNIKIHEVVSQLNISFSNISWLTNNIFDSLTEFLFLLVAEALGGFLLLMVAEALGGYYPRH